MCSLVIGTQVLGRVEDFLSGVVKVMQHVSFNSNTTVSVFETNIRVIGGLLSAHCLLLEVRARQPSHS
jgi:hypothetical protein